MLYGEQYRKKVGGFLRIMERKWQWIRFVQELLTWTVSAKALVAAKWYGAWPECI